MEYLKGVLLSMVLISSTPKTIEYVSPPMDLIAPPVELSIEDKIKIKALEYGLNPNTMLEIARAESQFRNVENYLYTDENGRYTAYGIFQITRRTWRAYCDEDNSLEQRSDIDKNIECAMMIASKSGLHHWYESGDWK
jgi:hypothetical protein